MSPGSLALERVTRRFGDHTAVNELSLEIPAGELLALVGASGSGKTTTLRIAAGYEAPDSGRVLLDGRDITSLPPQKRDFGMVFQHYALFPHLSVAQNVAFGLEARGVPRSRRMERATEALSAVGLGAHGSRTIQSLSGGEQQRVALARALVIEPKVLLMDEPLSNLDPTLRQSTREELRSMLHRVGVPALFVTHDQEDAFAIADRVALIRKGELLQVGTPEDLHDRPESLGVANFIGRATILPAEDLGSRAAITIAGVRREVTITRPASAAAATMPNPHVVLRPDALEVCADGEGWGGEVVNRRFTGANAVYRIKTENGAIVEIASRNMELREGDMTAFRIAREPAALVSGD